MWLGNRLWEAECLSPWIKIAFAITLEKSQGTIPGISLETILGKRQFWGSHNLFDSRLWSTVSALPKEERKTDYLLSYIPLPSHIAWPSKPLWTVSPCLFRLWNDKIQTRYWLAANGFPTYPFMKVSLRNWPSCSDLIVLQAREGSCGINTYIGTLDSLRHIFLTSGWNQALATPYISGWVINGHVLIFDNGRIEVPWPSIQLVTLIPENGYIRPVYAGNDFLAFQELIPSREGHYIKHLLYKLGELAVQEGYTGILGADLLYDPESKTVGFLEINPRLQGSTGLLSQLELNVGIIPAPARIFLSLLGQKISPAHYPDQVPYGSGIPVSQYLMRKQVSPKISFDKHSTLSYGKTISDATHKLVVQERILFDRSIFVPLFEDRGKLIL